MGPEKPRAPTKAGRYGSGMSDDDGHSGGDVTSAYDASSADMFCPGSVDPEVGLLTELASAAPPSTESRRLLGHRSERVTLADAAPTTRASHSATSDPPIRATPRRPQGRLTTAQLTPRNQDA